MNLSRNCGKYLSQVPMKGHGSKRPNWGNWEIGQRGQRARKMPQNEGFQQSAETIASRLQDIQIAPLLSANIRTSLFYHFKIPHLNNLIILQQYGAQEPYGSEVVQSSWVTTRRCVPSSYTSQYQYQYPYTKKITEQRGNKHAVHKGHRVYRYVVPIISRTSPGFSGLDPRSGSNPWGFVYTLHGIIYSCHVLILSFWSIYHYILLLQPW